MVFQYPISEPMTSKIKYSVLIVSENNELRQSCQRLLTGSGWRVVCAENENEGLKRVRAQVPELFSVAISGQTLSDSNKDTFLKQLFSLSPLTQRMIVIPSDKPEALIENINAGYIHACVCVPFTDREFLSRVNECRQSFKTQLDTEKLRRHVALQRRQVALAAKRLKSKKEKGLQHILNCKIKNARLKSQRSNNKLSLEKLVDHHEVPKKPKAFYSLFEGICLSVQRRLQRILPELDKEQMLPLLDDINGSTADPEGSGKITEQLKWLGLYDAFNQTDILVPRTIDPQEHQGFMDEHFTLTVSEDRMTARIVLQKPLKPGRVDTKNVLEYLARHNIGAELMENQKIEQWSKSFRSSGDSLVVAKGRPPVHAESEKIIWHISIDLSTPGKMNADGTIDFRDRGKTPFVEKDDLLAEKQPAVEGIDGFDVYGTKIPAKTSVDTVFEPGSGTRLSDDGNSIYAAAAGKPFIDTAGRIRVNEMLVIKKDVDFTTGHIHFDGDVVVNGTIRPGFEVKAVNLTAGAIEGATIELSGDLRVTDGIVDTQIRTVGNIRTRFINKCKIFGFGDFIVQNEIVDSRLLLGGHCLISSGSIVTASISARRGIEAKNIGSRYSPPPSLRIGIDDHAEHLIKEAKKDLQESMTKLSDLKEKMTAHNKRVARVLKRIDELDMTRKSQQAEIKQIQQQKFAWGNSHLSTTGLDKAIRTLNREISTADARTIEFLEELDRLTKVRDEIKEAILKQEQTNLELMKRKHHLTAVKNQKITPPEVVVHGTIFKGTKITGPNSQTFLKWDHNNCIIKETLPEPSLRAFKMAVLNR
jgi:uncharacterized protein (DUF342 family)/DNA-binding response OmpR family regulator